MQTICIIKIARSLTTDIFIHFQVLIFNCWGI